MYIYMPSYIGGMPVDHGGFGCVFKPPLKCKDGYDGPSYWELFAQFYYADLTVPAYCRKYARPDHPFKTPGMMCLNEKGVWETE